MILIQCAVTYQKEAYISSGYRFYAN